MKDETLTEKWRWKRTERSEKRKNREKWKRFNVVTIHFAHFCSVCTRGRFYDWIPFICMSILCWDMSVAMTRFSDFPLIVQLNNNRAKEWKVKKTLGYCHKEQIFWVNKEEFPRNPVQNNSNIGNAVKKKNFAYKMNWIRILFFLSLFLFFMWNSIVVCGLSQNWIEEFLQVFQHLKKFNYAYEKREKNRKFLSVTHNAARTVRIMRVLIFTRNNDILCDDDGGNIRTTYAKMLIQSKFFYSLESVCSAPFKNCFSPRSISLVFPILCVECFRCFIILIIYIFVVCWVRPHN